MGVRGEGEGREGGVPFPYYFQTTAGDLFTKSRQSFDRCAGREEILK